MSSSCRWEASETYLSMQERLSGLHVIGVELLFPHLHTQVSDHLQRKAWHSSPRLFCHTGHWAMVKKITFMRKKRFFLWVVLLLALCHLDGRSEVNWRLQVGGMYERPYELGFIEDNGKVGRKSSFNVGGGLYLQIPLGKTSPLYIETGLGYLYKPQLSVSEDFDFTPTNFADKWPESSNYVDYGMVSILEIPVKLGYTLRLNEVSQLEFGAGPYVSSAIK